MIIGGGGFRVPLVAAELQRTGFPVDELVLQDVSAERLAVVAAVLRDAPFPVRTTTDQRSALDGAEVVFVAIRVGGLDGRVRDERAGLDVGLLGQETVGVGGLRYAVRTLPEVDRLAAAVAEHAPRAWVVSLTNPAGLVTEAMAEVLGPRVIGVCDSPVALARRAAAAAGADPGESLAALTDALDVDYLGLNHLGWLRGLRAGDRDLLALLLTEPARLERFEEGRLFGADVITALGAIPNEYLYWYYAEREALRDVLAAGRTRGEHVRDRQREFYARAGADPERAADLWRRADDERNASYFAELREGERDEADLAAGGYESVAVALAAALTGVTGPARLILDVPNGRTVSELPADAVLETVCTVDTAGARPIPTGPPTLDQLGLMAAVKASERDLLAAARTGSKDRALRALVEHPLVRSLTAARRLAAHDF